MVSRLFQACPHSARAPFSPSPSPPFSFLLLSVSISPIPYAFRFPARSSGWISPPSQGKIPEKPFSCPSSTQILLQLLGLALHRPLLPKHNSTHLWNLHPPSWVDNFGLFGFLFFFYPLVGQGYWALPPFQRSTHKDYCCSPGQEHQEFVSPAVPLIPHPSSCTSRHYL